jgi:RND family efflux transporter MFP subunit
VLGRWALLGLVFLFGCHRAVDAEPAAKPKVVRCANVVTRSARDTLEVRGSIQPPASKDVQVASQVSGRVMAVEVKEGDAVVAGQVLARIEDVPLRDAVQQADAALARAKAERANAVTTLARAQRVFDRGIAPRQEVDDAVAKEAAARAGEAEASAAAHLAKRQLERAVLKGPLGGVVLKVFRRTGELVDGTPATPVVEVADTSTLELVADVPAQDLVRSTLGARAMISVPAIPGRAYQGTVTLISPSVDRVTGVGTLRVTLLAGNAAPPVGVYGVAKIDEGSARSSAFVPTQALRNAVGEQGEVVVCGTDRVAHVRKVQTGVGVDGLTELRSGGLGPNDRVAVAPVLGINDGEPIEVAP